MLHHRGLECAVNVRTTDSGPIIEGYAAKWFDGSPGTEFRRRDGKRERLSPKTFRRAMDSDMEVIGLFDHQPKDRDPNPTELLGRRSSGTLRIRSDDVGLWYEIDAEHQLGKVVTELIQRNDVPGSSFSFLDAGLETRSVGDDVVEIESLILRDVGPTWRPAYKGTTANARSMSDEADPWRQRIILDLRASAALGY